MISLSSSAFSSTLWDSGTTTMATTTQGTRSPDLSYSGSALASSTTYYWRIKFSDDEGAEGAWSTATSTFVLAASASLLSGGLQNISYTYDNVGNITRITDISSTGAGKIIVFGYDSLNRLTYASTTHASSTPYLHTFSYSSLGNITGMGTSSATTTYAYAGTGYANPHAPTSIGGVTLTYDNNGNVLTYGSKSYTWDYRNRMTQAGNGTATSTYGYDYAGNRVTLTDSTGTTKFANRLYSTNGATTTKYIYAGDTLIATVEKIGNATTTHIVHPDHLGGTNVITDASGNVVETLDYYPFGSIRTDTRTGSFDERKKYIGEQYDTATSLSYLNVRYYDGGRGQFLSQDPMFLGDPAKQDLGDPQNLNSYSYARDNPIINKDPDGREVITAVLTSPIWGPVIIGGAATLLYTSYNALSRQGRWGNVFSGTRQIPNVGWPEKPGEFEPNGNGNWKTWVGAGLSALGLGADLYKQYQDYKQDIKQFAPKQPSNTSSPSLSYNMPQSYVVQNNTTYTRTSNGDLSPTTLPATVTQGGVTYYRNSSGLLSTKPGL